MMSINVGDKLPDTTLVKVTADGPEKVQTSDYFAGKTVALFSVPGAYTPTCSARHLPGFVEKNEALKAKGIDEIACTAVNDAFVLDAWNKQNGDMNITMLADGNGEFASAHRAGNGCERVWHGQTWAALFDVGEGRRSRAAQYRKARRFLGQQRGTHAATNVRRLDLPGQCPSGGGGLVGKLR